jgi:glutaredoxin
MKNIQFYGALWCGDCIRSKIFLDKNQIAYDFHNTDEEAGAIELVERYNRGMKSIPTIIFNDGSFLTEPTDEQLAKKIGIKIH